MDSRAQAIFRQLKANPEDADLREHAEALVRRWHCSPESRFQADLVKGGRLDHAMRWEMDFSRVSVEALKNGGLLHCGERSGTLNTHVRIWYPTFDDLVQEFLLDDVRITVQANSYFSELVESLEEAFPGATIVSANVARVQQETRQWGESWPKPKRADMIDRGALEMEEGDATLVHGLAPGHNSWVA